MLKTWFFLSYISLRIFLAFYFYRKLFWKYLIALFCTAHIYTHEDIDTKYDTKNDRAWQLTCVSHDNLSICPLYITTVLRKNKYKNVSVFSETFSYRAGSVDEKKNQLDSVDILIIPNKLSNIQYRINNISKHVFNYVYSVSIILFSSFRLKHD